MRLAAESSHTAIDVFPYGFGESHPWQSNPTVMWPTLFALVGMCRCYMVGGSPSTKQAALSQTCVGLAHFLPGCFASILRPLPDTRWQFS